MIFTGINKQTVEFEITNYQFPEITDCEYDSNWLLIFLKVKSDCGNWQTIDPSLLVSEVKNIIEWIDKLSENETLNSDYLVFLEPNLEFELKSSTTEKKRIRIIFDLESRPKSADDQKEYFVDCEFNNAELKQIASELKKEIELYPERTL